MLFLCEMFPDFIIESTPVSNLRNGTINENSPPFTYLFLSLFSSLVDFELSLSSFVKN